jgi:hypothetical protein
VIAAINGATTAGGCILAMACDYRIMVAEGAVIGRKQEMSFWQSTDNNNAGFPKLDF